MYVIVVCINVIYIKELDGIPAWIIGDVVTGMYCVGLSLKVRCVYNTLQVIERQRLTPRSRY